MLAPTKGPRSADIWWRLRGIHSTSSASIRVERCAGPVTGALRTTLGAMSRRLLRHLAIGALVWTLVPGLFAQNTGGILVVAPPPDDDVITAAGVTLRAHHRGEPVWIVYVTNGDAAAPTLADVRQAEAVAGQRALETPEDHLIFLGYPDGGLAGMRSGYATAGSAFTSAHGRSATFASRGWGGADYHSRKFGAPGKYNWPTLVGDLADAIATLRPDHIVTSSQWE